ncbi:uncharacterized protein LOC105691097 isoform X3 [Athalia rosae]|uniref:uncharacterized protein LOC105691097 isoform X3 n=1 Tax=Athalia rosae TaxID=37344 RepID=UPI00062547EC|nr:uncharacterized protein LOC105691097 isoform X3 [Athalia rosae]
MKFSETENSQADEEVDPVNRMLKKTGCIELHYKVQECIADTQDWRKCQEPVQQFKNCMEKYQKSRSKPDPIKYIHGQRKNSCPMCSCCSRVLSLRFEESKVQEGSQFLGNVWAA